MRAEVFQPAKFSLPELHFMLEHLEESPTVALHGSVPKGVNPDAIRPTLARFTELEELQRVRNVPWVGYDPIRESIERFIAYQAKCRQGQELGEPRHPSFSIFDSQGSAMKAGVGSDASDMVRNELKEDGTRQPFGVQLVGTQRKSRMWRGKQPVTVTVDEITHAENGTLTCTICEKVVASYDTDKGSRARNKAKADARKHCMTTKKEHARHRAIANVPIL